MSALLQDARFGLRMLGKTPGVTAVVILSLGLGIGANTAVFTILNALLLRSLPVDQPDRLVLYSEGDSRGFITGQSGRWNIFSYPLYRRLRDQQTSFQGVAAFRTMLDRLNVRREGAASNDTGQLARARLVSGNYFSVLRVQAALGRTLAPEDESVAAAPVAVLSFEYWKRSFHASPAVVGQVMNMNGAFVTVAGVAPAEFFGESMESELADLWLPLTLQPQIMPRRSALEDAEIGWVNLIARLKPGISMAQAQADVNVTFQQFLTEQAGGMLTTEQQERLRRNYVELAPGGGGVSNLRARYSRPLHILLAAVGFVLLIACANVANLLLSRAAAREKEISMRLALGAGRTRLLRQALTESLLLAGLGGAVGVLFSSWMVSVLVAGISTGGRVIPLNVSPNATVLGFTLGLCLLTGVLFGLAPALRAARADVWPALQGSPFAGRKRPRWGLARAFVVAQIGLSLPLLAGAGLLAQTLRQLRTQDFGFSPEQVLEVEIYPSLAGYRPDQLEPLYRALLDRVNAVPGVRAASLSLYSPMSGDNWSGEVAVEGYAPASGRNARCQWVWVGPRYVETAGMTLLIGRDLSERDTQNSPLVAVVNESFARRYLSGQNPIGRHLSMGKSDIEIVGVVRDFKFNNPRQDIWPVVFLPLVQASMTPARYARFLEIRTAGDPAGVGAAVREAVRQVDRNLPVAGIRTLTRQVDEMLSRERLVAGLSGFFAMLALLLACIGLGGVLAYAVTRRAREIGIRLAVGARRADILSMILREALLLAAIGVAIGLVASLGLTVVLSSQLYGVRAADPRTLAAAALLLGAAAVLAALWPARRAAGVDPIRTLRAE